jgi:hypothetical protein
MGFMKGRWLFAVCVLALSLFTGGCEDDAGNWSFRNQSSYRVYVAPNGQTWPSAMIGPGSTVEVDYNGEQIQYVYRPSNKVTPVSAGGRTIEFRNLR